MISFRYLTLAFLLLLNFTPCHSQMKVFANGVEIKEGVTLNLNEIKTLSCKYSGVNKMSNSLDGYAKLFIYDSYNEVRYSKIVTGIAACDDLLYKSDGKEFFAWREDGTADLDESSKLCFLQHTNRCKYVVGQETIDVEMGILFASKTGYNKYGTEVMLITPFKFKISIWSGEVPVTLLSASFSPSDFPEYKKLGYPINFILKGNDLRFEVFEFANPTLASERLEFLKSSLVNNLGYYANQCNGGKYLKGFTEPDESFWKTHCKFNAENVLAQLNKKTNPTSTYSVWENFEYGSVKGVKLATASTTLNCSYPENSGKEGNFDVIVLFIHPTNPNKLVYASDFEGDQRGGSAPVANLKYCNDNMEKLLKALKFH